MNYTITPLKPFGLKLEPRGKKIHVGELEREKLREMFWKEQLLLLRGFETFRTSEEFSRYAELWGEVALWPFGKVLELIEQDHPEDHIFDHNYVPLHWDGMYRPQIPEYQIFHCVRAPLPGQGGRTTFSNTALALKKTSYETRELWEKVAGTYQRKMEFYDSTTTSPIIVKHPLRGFPVIRYNEPPSNAKGVFINPPNLTFTGIGPEEMEAFHLSLQETLYHPDHFYAHEWQPGDIVIADNFSLLHGREGFVSKAPRHIQRVHVLSDPPFDNPGLKAYR